MIPTINKVVRVYLESATIERLKCGKPGAGTVGNTRAGVRKFLQYVETRELLGDKYKSEDLVGNIPISYITPRIVRKYLALLLKDGVKPVSAVSYVQQFRQLFARWTHPYYEDRGWKIPQFPTIVGHANPPRYNRPKPEQLAQVKAWYLSLTERVKIDLVRRSETPDSSSLVPHPSSLNLWYVTTMMLEFGVRNGDVLRLKRTNFIEVGDKRYLTYTPHKTENSSGRIVKWPIHPDFWSILTAIFTANGEDTPTIDYDVTFGELNRRMRGFGFAGTKGAYELRKICIDHVYQRFGAEIAVSISGDDIKTIMHYYADPAQPNIGELKVVDLI